MDINDFKLKHIDLLIGEKIQYLKLMKEMFGYKHNLFNKIFRYKKAFALIYSFIQNFSQIKPESLEYKNDSGIRKPKSIDNITFIAMMEINMVFGNSENAKRSIGELMGEIIAIACYSSNLNQDFDIDSYSFEKFLKRVMDEPAHKMIGLYNWIEKSIKESSKMWSTLFFQVEVIDKDYEMAGGSEMKAFNVINSIRGICEDFNVPYKEAWQMTYSVTQSNSLSKAKAAYIQDKMAKIKEARMKAQQKKK